MSAVDVGGLQKVKSYESKQNYWKIQIKSQRD